MHITVLYEDNDVLAVEKPAGIIVFQETSSKIQDTNTVIGYLAEKFPTLTSVGAPPRYGVVHRLDKDTSGILLVAKRPEALIFLQKQFKNRTLEKRYLALVVGRVKGSGQVTARIGRSPKDPRKQKAYSEGEYTPASARQALTEYRVLQNYQHYTLLEVSIKTGRKHQIRCHLAHIHHPVAGDPLYTFKDSPRPAGLARQFLHASYLKITLPDGSMKEFTSELPEDLQTILKRLEIRD